MNSLRAGLIRYLCARALSQWASPGRSGGNGPDAETLCGCRETSSLSIYEEETLFPTCVSLFWAPGAHFYTWNKPWDCSRPRTSLAKNSSLWCGNGQRLRVRVITEQAAGWPAGPGGRSRREREHQWRRRFSSGRLRVTSTTGQNPPPPLGFVWTARRSCDTTLNSPVTRVNFDPGPFWGRWKVWSSGQDQVKVFHFSVSKQVDRKVKFLQLHFFNYRF